MKVRSYDDIRGYRLKTHAELIRDYGLDWKRNIDFGYIPAFDSLLGKSIEDAFVTSTVTGVSDSREGFKAKIKGSGNTQHWTVSIQLITRDGLHNYAGLNLSVASDYVSTKTAGPLIKPLDNSLFEESKPLNTKNK